MKSTEILRTFSTKNLTSNSQNIHQKKLAQIYAKNPLTSMTINSHYFEISNRQNNRNQTKKSIQDQMEHHLRLKHLINRLNSPKSYQDRIKDTNDFLAYPSMFFRNPNIVFKVKNNKKKLNNLQRAKNEQNQMKKSAKNLKKHYLNNDDSSKQNSSKKNKKASNKKGTDSHSVNSQLPHSGLTLQKVKSQLPYLQQFQQQDIQQFADHLTRIIFKYNLNSMNNIQFLFECVQEYIPQHYPQHFIDAIEDMFKEIVNSLNIID